jgi:hypothetical protein
MKTKQVIRILKNENGSVLLIAVLILIALTVVGISAISTSTIDIQISGNDKFHKMAFFAADAGVSYVAGHPDLYGPDNTTPGGQLTFPDINDATITYALSNQLQFNGNVPYVGKTNLPRGSGYSAGTYKAINYQVVSASTGTSNGAGSVHAGFYRVGL